MSRWMLPLIVTLLAVLSLPAQEPVPTAVRSKHFPHLTSGKEAVVVPLNCEPAVGKESTCCKAKAGRNTKTVYISTIDAPPWASLPYPYPSFEQDLKRSLAKKIAAEGKLRVTDKREDAEIEVKVNLISLNKNILNRSQQNAIREEELVLTADVRIHCRGASTNVAPVRVSASSGRIFPELGEGITTGEQKALNNLVEKIVASTETLNQTTCSPPVNPTNPARPAYIIEPPDNISIQALLKNGRGTQELPGQSISGSFLVRMDGRVNLGVWGTVSVTGMTLDQAAEAVRQVVVKGLNEPKMEPVKADQILVLVDVVASNSKRYYVITESNEGQQVTAHAWTGNESVLDAIGNVGGWSNKAARSNIWVARFDSKKGEAKQLPVDWIGITQRGDTSTNYILQSGDRLCIQSKEDAPSTGYTRLTTIAASAPGAPTLLPTAIAKKLPLAGTWFREMPGAVAAFNFRDDEFSLAVTISDGEDTFTITLSGDCAITRDGTVHGVITGIDMNSAGVQDKDSIDELAELSRKMQGMVDQPLAIRFRPSGGGMMVSNARFADGGDLLKELVPGICGLYQSATNAPVPKPKAVKERKTFLHRCEPAPMMLVPGANGFGPPPFQHIPQLGVGSPVPQDFAFPVGPVPAGYGLPAHPVYPPSALPPSCPAPSNPPPEIQRMMFKAIGMGSVPQPMPEAPAVCSPPAGPSDAVWVSRPMDIPDSPPLALGSGNLPLGTWTRKADGLQVKLEVKQDHVALTGTGKDGQCWLAIDCYPTRAAGEVVGMIRSCELKPAEGAISPDFLPEVTAAAAELCNKPIAFKFRLCDGALILDGVNAPKEITNLAGEYKKVNPSTPSPNLKR